VFLPLGVENLCCKGGSVVVTLILGPMCVLAAGHMFSHNMPVTIFLVVLSVLVEIVSSIVHFLVVGWQLLILWVRRSPMGVVPGDAQRHMCLVRCPSI